MDRVIVPYCEKCRYVLESCICQPETWRRALLPHSRGERVFLVLTGLLYVAAYWLWR